MPSKHRSPYLGESVDSCWGMIPSAEQIRWVFDDN